MLSSLISKRFRAQGLCGALGGRTDYLDFDWKGNGDDLVEVKNRYDDFLRQEKAGPAGGRGGGEFSWTNRRKSAMGGGMGNRNSMDMYDMYDEFEDDYEDERAPPPPKETEKRYLNGKHILTNREIT